MTITIGARVTPAMHKELKLLAALNGTTQSVEIIKALRERICVHRKQLERMRASHLESTRKVKLEEVVKFLDKEHPNWHTESRVGIYKMDKVFDSSIVAAAPKEVRP